MTVSRYLHSGGVSFVSLDPRTSPLRKLLSLQLVWRYFDPFFPIDLFKLEELRLPTLLKVGKLYFGDILLRSKEPVDCCHPPCVSSPLYDLPLSLESRSWFMNWFMKWLPTTWHLSNLGLARKIYTRTEILSFKVRLSLLNFILLTKNFPLFIIRPTVFSGIALLCRPCSSVFVFNCVYFTFY